MKLKVGDILISKIDICKGSVSLKKNGYYRIHSFDKINPVVMIITDDGISGCSIVHVDDFFYTLKEFRKLKLDKIDKYDNT